jgi:hypothetical protein
VTSRTRQSASSSVHQSFSAALDALVEQVKADRSVLAVILCGSLSHDTVWAKSDIDLVLVTIDDKKIQTGSVALYADGINVHAWVLPRADFRKIIDGAIHNSFLHSLLAKGRLLYSHDDSLAAHFASLQKIGERDIQVQLLHAGTHALSTLYKAHKWIITRGDLDYTALWILYTATPLAQAEVISRGLLADREVIPQALKLNPSFFKTIYVDLLNSKKTAKNVRAALDAIDHYIAERASKMFGAIIEHLADVGEVRSCTEIEKHFEQNFGVKGVTTACEYLSDQGLIGKASTPVQLTKKSNTSVQELAFYYLEA